MRWYGLRRGTWDGKYITVRLQGAHAGELQYTGVILLFDEDEAGRKGRAEACTRLARWLNVDALQFEKEDTQPEDLTAEEVVALLGGAP